MHGTMNMLLKSVFLAHICTNACNANFVFITSVYYQISYFVISRHVLFLHKLKSWHMHRSVVRILNVIWHVCFFMNVNCLCLLSITIMYFVFNPVSPAGDLRWISLFVSRSCSTTNSTALLSIPVHRYVFPLLFAYTNKQRIKRMQIHRMYINKTQIHFRGFI